MVVPGAGFLNDVAIARKAVYVTDSFGDALTVVALDGAGRPVGEASPLTLVGDYKQPGGFGANGIRELPGGDLVLVSGGVLVLRLHRDQARTIGVLSDEELDRPTTGALIGSALYVVNGRFDTLASQPDAQVHVTKLRLR